MAILRSLLVLTINKVLKLLNIAGKSVNKPQEDYVERKKHFFPKFFVLGQIYLGSSYNEFDSSYHKSDYQKINIDTILKVRLILGDKSVELKKIE